MQKGKSIAAFLAARQLLPRDPDIKHNLNFVHSEIPDKVNLDDSGSLASLLSFWTHLFTLQEMKTLCYFFACLGLFIFLLGSFFEKLSGSKNFAVVSLVFSLLFIFFWQSSSWQTKSWAAVAVQETELRSGPAKYNTVLFKLPVVVEEKRNDWYKVSFSGDKKAWIESKDLAYFPV